MNLLRLNPLLTIGLGSLVIAALTVFIASIVTGTIAEARRNEALKNKGDRISWRWGICVFGAGGQTLAAAINAINAMRAYADYNPEQALMYLGAAGSGLVAAVAIYKAGRGFFRRLFES